MSLVRLFWILVVALLTLVAGSCAAPENTSSPASVATSTTRATTTSVPVTTTTVTTPSITAPTLVVPFLDLGRCSRVAPSPINDGLGDLAEALQGMCEATNMLADAISLVPSFDAGWGHQSDVQTAAEWLVEAGDRLEAIVDGIRSTYDPAPGPTLEFLDELEWTLSGSELTLKYLPALFGARSGEMVEEFWNLGAAGLPSFIDMRIARFEAMLEEEPTLQGWFDPCFGLEVSFDGPESGWIVTAAVLEFRVDGTATPDSAVVGSEELQITRRNYWWESSTTLRLDKGVNEVPVIVECNGAEAFAVTIPITFLPEAQLRLADAISATGDSITVDWLRWDDSGEFPGPVDDDPGVTETLPVADDLVVMIGRASQPDIGYEWLVDRIESGESTEDAGWGPYYPYWVTLLDGVVVQLEMVPLG